MAIVTLILYVAFLFVQNIWHKPDFVSADEVSGKEENPSVREAVISGGMLMVCLGAVVILAKSLAPALESWIESIGAPISLAGVIIATVILLPEGFSAIRSAKNNQLQKSFNLSLGSAIASKHRPDHSDCCTGINSYRNATYTWYRRRVYRSVPVIFTGYHPFIKYRQNHNITWDCAACVVFGISFHDHISITK